MWWQDVTALYAFWITVNLQSWCRLALASPMQYKCRILSSKLRTNRLNLSILSSLSSNNSKKINQTKYASLSAIQRLYSSPRSLKHEKWLLDFWSLLLSHKISTITKSEIHEVKLLIGLLATQLYVLDMKLLEAKNATHRHVVLTFDLFLCMRSVLYGIFLATSATDFNLVLSTGMAISVISIMWRILCLGIVNSSKLNIWHCQALKKYF